MDGSYLHTSDPVTRCYSARESRFARTKAARGKEASSLHTSDSVTRCFCARESRFARTKAARGKEASSLHTSDPVTRCFCARESRFARTKTTRGKEAPQSVGAITTPQAGSVQQVTRVQKVGTNCSACDDNMSQHGLILLILSMLNLSCPEYNFTFIFVGMFSSIWLNSFILWVVPSLCLCGPFHRPLNSCEHYCQCLSCLVIIVVLSHCASLSFSFFLAHFAHAFLALFFCVCLFQCRFFLFMCFFSL